MPGPDPSHNPRDDRVGRCTEVMAEVLGTPLGCTLSHGHTGQHHDSFTGAYWWPGWQRRSWLGRTLIALGERLS